MLVRASAVAADILIRNQARFFVFGCREIIIVIRVRFVNVFFDYFAFGASLVSNNGNKLDGAIFSATLRHKTS